MQVEVDEEFQGFKVLRYEMLILVHLLCTFMVC